MSDDGFENGLCKKDTVALVSLFYRVNRNGHGSVVKVGKVCTTCKRYEITNKDYVEID